MIKIVKGKKKSAIVRANFTSGESSINGKNLSQYFCSDKLLKLIESPFRAIEGEIELQENFKLIAKGGGIVGQAVAASKALARLIVAKNPSLKKILKKQKLLTSDSRKKESKLYNRLGSRRGKQKSKR